MDNVNNVATGQIVLNGFELEAAEKAIVENLVKNYKHKMSEKGKFEYVQLRTRKSQKGKTFMHEVEGKMKANGKLFNSKSTDYNLFAATDAVLDKLLNELIHTQRTSRQRK